MVVIKGSHGTTASSVESIDKYGWRIGTGRAGTGVYFWKECDLYIELAIGWYRRALAEDRYKYYSNTACNVIIADLEAEEDEILDLENRKLKENIYKMAKQRALSYTNTRELASLYDLFISELESEFGHVYKIVTAEVAPPGNKYCTYPIEILGGPICCAVRDTGCIDKVDVLKCEDYRNEK